jgi:hypothetical protein
MGEIVVKSRAVARFKFYGLISLKPAIAHICIVCREEAEQQPKKVLQVVINMVELRKVQVMRHYFPNGV